MTQLPYVKYELLRTVRNRRSFVFTIAIPLIFYFVLAIPNRHDHNFGSSHSVPHTGIFAPQYYMLGLLSFGGMVAVLSGGARIAQERSVGWNRQLRLTPLTPRAYFRAKILTSYLMAGTAIVLLYACGIALGVRLPFVNWLVITGLVLVALIPFAAMGVAFGHLLSIDSMGPAIGGVTSLFAFLGGTWFPLVGSGGFIQFCKCLPSFWLVQAGRIGSGPVHDPWGARGWLTIAIWSVVAGAAAVWAYRRDTKRA